jgi:hypothetical protein
MRLNLRRLMAAILVLGIVSGLLTQAVPFAAAAPRALLTDNIISYWSMDETSGVRYDGLTSCGGSGCDLSDTNTVGYATGKIGNAASFDSDNNEYFTHADHDDLSLGSSFSFAGWVNPSSVSGDQIFFTRDDAGATRDFAVRTSGSNLYFVVYDGGSTPICAAFVGTITANAWNFVAATYDESTDTCSVSINAGTQNQNNDYSGTGDTSNSNLAIHVGVRQDGYGEFDGLLDEWGFWKRALSTTEIGYLYNGSAGCTHPFSACDATPTPTNTSTPTATYTPSATPTNTPTNTPTPTPAVVIVISATPIDSPTPLMQNYITINENPVAVLLHGGNWVELATLILLGMQFMFLLWLYMRYQRK